VELWKRFAQLWKRQEIDSDDPYSIVLLQRERHFFTSVEIEAAGERGWGKSFDGKADPMYFVVQKGSFTMIKAGTQVVNVLHAKGPYLGDRQEIADQLSNVEQKDAWLAHNAWLSLDLLLSKLKKAEAYATLARFALQLGDANCTAVYLPKENVLMPNDGTAEEGLRRMIRQELFF
jgi:hypothetical protein